jgi:excisionase family DNA binding protein
VKDEETMLDTKDVATILKLSERTVLTMAARGELRGVQVTNKKLWRFKRSDIEDYLQRRREQHDRSSSA